MTLWKIAIARDALVKDFFLFIFFKVLFSLFVFFSDLGEVMSVTTGVPGPGLPKKTDDKSLIEVGGLFIL